MLLGSKDTGSRPRVLLSPQEEPCLPDSALGPVSPSHRATCLLGAALGGVGAGRVRRGRPEAPGLGGPGEPGAQGRWGLSGSQDTRLEDQ